MPKDKNLAKEMIGGCCVCSDDRGWRENPLVYCDGEGCNVAVHQACYGIVTIPTTNWYCRKCETPDLDPVKCELCPSSVGALKPTDGRGWAHVVCALYIPEVSFGNVTTMEPIIINQIPQERFNKNCYICEEGGKGAIARVGACMQCNRSGCRQVFHVTCAQAQGLLCEEAGNYQDNVKYCGYCHHHYNKLKKGSHVKTIPPYRPLSSGDEVHDEEPKHAVSKRKISSSGGSNKGSKNAGLSGGNTGSNNEATGDDSSQLPNGDSPELVKSSLTSNKKRKSNRSSTPGVHSDATTSSTGHPNESPRPQTPSTLNPVARSSSPSNPLFNNTNGGVSKVGSIVVQVPLEAAGVGGGTSPSRSPHHGTGTVPISPPISDSSSSHVPTKRSRSESSDKGEKRRSKRSSGGLSRPHSKSSPHSRVKSSPEPTVGLVIPTSSSSSNSTKFITTSLTMTHVTPSTTPVVKEEKDVKLYENGVGAAHMLGNQLAPGSSMVDTLSQEVAAHSIYTKPSASSHVGPHFPRPTPVSYRGPGSNSGLGPWGSSGSNMPQTLEQLLERQWEQGSQFLMEQAHHFDIASLLSCLHQLKAENAQLEEHVNSLQARRDNLLAVNARLAIPLITPHLPPGGNNVGAGGGRSSSNSTPASTTASSVANATIASAVLTNASGGTTPSAAIVENGIPSPHEQYRLSAMHSRVDGHRSGSSGLNTTGSTFSSTVPSVPSSSPHLNTPSGGSTLPNSSLHPTTGLHTTPSHGSSSNLLATSGNVMHASGNTVHNTANPTSHSQTPQSSVVVRATSATPTLSSQPQPSRSTSSAGYSSSGFSSTNPQMLVRRADDQHKPTQNS